MTTAAPFEVEQFWDHLLAFVEEGRVIPIVGPSLLRVDEDGQTVPLYAAVARRLLKKCGVPENTVSAQREPRERGNELNDAVAYLAEHGKRIRDLYLPIHGIIEEIAGPGRYPQSLPVLRDLASITHFDLFATTTPDQLLARALNVTRFAGAQQTQELEYAPKLPTGRRRDMPETPTTQYAGVFHLFGRTDVQPFFAIHDEDMLEFAYALQQHGVPPERFFSQLKGRNLLFIGCNFSGWLNRFFLRMSNSDRLSSDDRNKSEFLVDDDTGDDGNLTIFLKRFSRNSRPLPVDPVDFVSELVRRWKVRNPDASRSNGQNGREAFAPAAPTAAGTVFISYASEDAAAAKALCGDLNQIGADVAWYDKSALRPGDNWSESIKGAIQRCGIFLPVISANTEHRTEGYFREEWLQAVERTRRIQGKKFIFPVVVDPEAGGMDRYANFPGSFKKTQFSHAPAGHMAEPLRGEIQTLLREFRRTRAT